MSRKNRKKKKKQPAVFKILKICPDHNVSLFRRQTRYGGRWMCPVDGCTVACWDGSTSTPADQETRDARIEAHDAFDALWRDRHISRSEAYRRLAAFMNVGKHETHIGMFDKEQCEIVVEFSRSLLFELQEEGNGRDQETVGELSVLRSDCAGA